MKNLEEASPECSSDHTSSATQRKWLASFYTSSSDQTRRPKTPLFHVQPSGCPFIAQRSTGRSSFRASRTAAPSSVLQPSRSHFVSSALGRMKSIHFLYELSFRAGT